MLCLKIKFQNIELRKDYGNEGWFEERFIQQFLKS
jgi:hypothetical protein